MIYKYTVISSLGFSVTAFVATIGTRCVKYILPVAAVANNCGYSCQIFNVFYFRKRRKKIKKTLKT